MHVEVVIPFGTRDEHRLKAMRWVINHLPPYSVRVAYGSPSKWVKANAFNPAVEHSAADIIIMHDGDIYCPGLPEAVQAVADGHSWAIPHRRVYRLNQYATEAYMRSELTWPPKPSDLDRAVYDGIIGGGIIVARRDVFLDVPLDPRFQGWGQEDEAHGAALETLYRPAWRGEADLIHLWHPAEPRVTNRWGSERSRRLYQERYHLAIGNPKAMRDVIDEIHNGISTTPN